MGPLDHPIELNLIRKILKGILQALSLVTGEPMHLIDFKRKKSCMFPSLHKWYDFYTDKFILGE